MAAARAVDGRAERRGDLIDQVRETLAQAGFAVSERCDLRPVSFDLVARRDSDLLIVKVLTNIDALSDAVATEIKTLSKFLGARPVVVGLRAGTGALEGGVVYARHDLPIVTPATLSEYVLAGTAPMVFASPGGYYVSLDAAALRAAREQARLSLGVLAQVAGVSRRAIQMYEEGMHANIDAAMRLEEYLAAELILPVDPFSAFDARSFQPPEPEPAQSGDPMERLVRDVLEGMGYRVHATRRSPFDALVSPAEVGTTGATGMTGRPAAAPSGRPDETLLTGVGEDSPQLRRRARIVTSVSRVMERPGFFVVERTTRTTLEGLPIVSREELDRLTDPEKVLELILERRPRDRPDQ